MIILVFLVNILCLPFSLSEISDSELAEQLYINLLKKRRAEQLEAVKSLQKMSNYEKQYSMIVLVAEKVFTVVQDSRATIEASSFIPGVSDFPLDENVQNALSNIIENTALFCEVIIRLPDISAAVLKTNNNWDVILQWSVAFCNQVKYLLDRNTVRVLHLASQELNHVPRESNYYNPYRKVEKSGVPVVSSQVKKKKKKSIKKGPKLSSHHEL